jgi:hypothetical protein
MSDLGPITWVWNMFPWYVQLGAIGYVALSSIGGTVAIYNWTKSWAGKWSIPAMASLVIPLAFWIYTLLRGSKPVPNDEVWPDPDQPVKPKKKVRTFKFPGFGK